MLNPNQIEQTLSEIDIDDYFSKVGVKLPFELDGHVGTIFFEELLYGGYECTIVIHNRKYTSYGHETYDGRVFSHSWTDIECTGFDVIYDKNMNNIKERI